MKWKSSFHSVYSTRTETVQNHEKVELLGKSTTI